MGEARRVRGRVAVAVLVFALVATVSARATAQGPILQARAALLIESSTGDVLLSRNARARREIASTTKLMTALVTVEHTDLNDIFSASSYRPSPAESQIGLRTGERMSVRDLLQAALLPSANDAAATLAVGALGTQQAFVAEMNRRARALGLHDTHFANPIGLDDAGNYSSARDLATLAIRLRANPFIRRTMNLSQALLRSGSHPRLVVNRNTLVRRYGFVDGVKTGHTGQAGYVLVGSATRHGVNVVSVVMGEPSERARDADSIALLRYGLRSYQATTPLRAGRVLGSVGLRYRDGESVDVLSGATVHRVLRVGEHTSVTVSTLPGHVDGPLPRGSRLATATVRHGATVVARVPVLTAAPVVEAGLGDRLNDFVNKSQTLVAIVLLLVCSLPLMVMRNRVVRRRRAIDVEDRRAGSREEGSLP